MKNKKALEMSFAWIFSMIVGAVILFLAIYIASQFIGLGKYEVSTKTAKEFTNLLDPLQTSVEESKISSVKLIIETKIYTSCSESGKFGNSILEFSEKIKLGREEWSEKSAPISTNTSYVFSDNEIQGDKVYFFVTSLKMPFKIADLMIMHTKTYCLVNPVDKIDNEISDLISGNSEAKIEIKNSLDECTSGSVGVCFNSFSSEECNVNVRCSDSECGSGIVTKDNKDIAFLGNLVYGAIFSSKDNYECNVKRIMMRLSKLSRIYSQKAQLISTKCSTGLSSEMEQLAELADKFEKIEQLSSIIHKSEQINNINKNLECQLF